MACSRGDRSDAQQVIGDGDSVFTRQVSIAAACPAEAGIDPDGSRRERWQLIAETQDAFQHVGDLGRGEPVITVTPLYRHDQDAAIEQPP
ncbi:hypothetical protein D3C72_1555850 [compost metagenome]